MNEVDIHSYPFEFDLTWMAFFQNYDGKTYARYGGREDGGPETHLSKASLMKTMERVLSLHKTNATKAWSKYEPKPGKTFTPLQIPPMKSMLAKRKEKCIHCHDVKNATLYDRLDNGLLNKEDIYTYPSPKQLGIVIDVDDQIKVTGVENDSVAAAAGIKNGDIITEVDGQRVLTFADFTRVLELAPESGSVEVTTTRNGALQTSRLPLRKGWRRSNDPSWRSSTSAVGPNSGFWAKVLTPGQRKQLQLGDDDLALKVVVVWGQWAKKAGIKNNDVIVEIDGLDHNMTIRQLQTHLQLNHDFKDQVKLVIKRGGRNRDILMTLPERGERH